MGRDDAACWTAKDETCLLEHLVERASAAGDGGSFTTTTFNEIAPLVDAVRTSGGKKTPKSCQAKYGILRRIFRAIQDIKHSKSGWTWDDKLGANIGPDMEEAWVHFLKAHSHAKPFKNKGWTHLEQITRLMPATVKGTNVFRASQGVTGIQDSFQSATIELDHPLGDEGKEDEEGSEVEEEEGKTDDVVTPVSASVRFNSSGAETPAPSSKKTRVTGADAISGLTASISRFGDNMCKVLAGNPADKTPHRHTKAVQRAQAESWLLPPQRLRLFKILEGDIKAADAYLALNEDDQEFRELWIMDKIENAHL
ncbi:hypothetical protein H0H93_005684 [Arthromyces matolae]|nr:hypothetical protein H0H93_005684 [Arthromyces matolae]